MIEKCIQQKEPQIEIHPEDFSEKADLTILVLEREGYEEQSKKSRFEKSKAMLLSYPGTP